MARRSRKDEYNKQLAINNFRIDSAQRRIRTLLTAGQIRTADAQARLAALDQRSQQAATIALEQLIDGRSWSSSPPSRASPSRTPTWTPASPKRRRRPRCATPG